MAKANVKRPPTPDPDEDARELKLEEKIRYQFFASGERDRLKILLTERLTACGWKDDIKERCREYINKRGRNNVTVEDLVRAVRPEGRQSVPDNVKAELLSEIKQFILNL